MNQDPDRNTTSDGSQAGPGGVPERCHVVLIPSDRLGSGPEELGSILMRSFLKTLKDAPVRPWRMVLINAGVRLAVEGSDLVDDLRALQGSGIGILACGTCLDFFHARDKLTAGRVSNMREIVDTLTAADKVIRV